MKWFELYLAITVADDEAFHMSSLFEKISDGESFPFRLITDYEGQDKEPVFWEVPVNLVILAIKVLPNGGLELLVKTKGVLPSGLKHGVYTINFDEYGVKSELPEMFEDGDVPEDLIPESRFMQAANA